MADKLPPECVECYTNIEQHSKQVFLDIEQKTDAFFDKHEKKFDNLETKLLGMIKWTLGIVLFVVSICAGVVALNYMQIQEKASKAEVLRLEDAKKVFELHDKYSDERYVLNPDQTVDPTNYQWVLETLFERATRSGKKLERN